MCPACLRHDHDRADRVGVNHSIRDVLERRHGIVQVCTVVLTALLALVRKFIIIDAMRTELAWFTLEHGFELRGFRMVERSMAWTAGSDLMRAEGNCG